MREVSGDGACLDGRAQRHVMSLGAVALRDFEFACAGGRVRRRDEDVVRASESVAQRVQLDERAGLERPRERRAEFVLGHGLGLESDLVPHRRFSLGRVPFTGRAAAGGRPRGGIGHAAETSGTSRCSRRHTLGAIPPPPEPYDELADAVAERVAIERMLRGE